jgi:hypothetical protein
MMRSAFFCKPDFDNSNSSKAVSNKKKREYGSGNGSRESSSLQERLQTSVEAIENCRPPPTSKVWILDGTQWNSTQMCMTNNPVVHQWVWLSGIKWALQDVKFLYNLFC